MLTVHARLRASDKAAEPCDAGPSQNPNSSPRAAVAAEMPLTLHAGGRAIGRRVPCLGITRTRTHTLTGLQRRRRVSTSVGASLPLKAVSRLGILGRGAIALQSTALAPSEEPPMPPPRGARALARRLNSSPRAAVAAEMLLTLHADG